MVHRTTSPENSAVLLAPRQNVPLQALTISSEGGRIPYTMELQGQGLSAAQLLRKLRRGLWLIALTSVAGGALAYWFGQLMPDNYVASGILAVESQRFAIPELQGALSGDTGSDPLPEVLTEVQVLTSPRLLGQVINTLHLDRDPEFDPRIKQPSLFKQAVDAINPDLIHQMDDWLDQLAAMVGIPATPKAPDLSPDVIQQIVLGEVLSRLVVTHDDRSFIIKIQNTAKNPRTAAAVVNTLIDVYEQARFDDHERINKAANASLMRRVEDVHSQAVTLEEKVRAARAQNDQPQLERGNVSQQQLGELITAATRSSVERSQTAAIAARAHALAQSGATDELASVVGSATISRLRDQETQAGRLVAEGQSRYGDNYPALQSARASLQSVRNQIGSEVRRTVSSLDMQAKTAEEQDQKIQGALVQARTTSQKAAGGQLEITQLEEEAASRRKLYETLLTRAEQTQTDPSQQTVTGARVVSTAFVPAIPSGPRRKMATGIGAVGGMLAGGFLALVGGKGRRRRFLSGGDLASTIGLPVLAKLPQLSRAIPGAGGVEALRLLRSRIRFNGVVSPARTIVFVPAGGKADAAATSIAFARIAALDGERVLLIEGSVTEPMLAAKFGSALPSNARNGLEDLLVGSVSLQDAVTTDPATNLDMLLVDKPSASLLGLVHGTRFQMLLADAVQNYSLVVISAPSPQRSETLALTHAAEATIFVVGSSPIRSESLQSLVAGLANNNYGFAAAVLAA